MDDDTETTNMRMLLDDLAELAIAWRRRGFDADAICAALGTGALLACEHAGVTREQAHDVVDHHYGRLAHDPAVAS